ncbi:type VII secretion protein EccCa [Tumebacillus permanentifrigoris]|uniref:S-DNA-T family DNA segregation ATPase FtsK/SpoIIIE n=1 Tax=Tumebacillus permanentifrigoris TaxID=378543 RepID=A0A316D976_9BACL|nr:type VII secretion protein EccCa [Tumebacillus permanentifrigoris]PWK13519.1 S-DNA-T family DNA segregation ATPase FtsK/SpoIIIE [Tumebacillus permanentifrigoris]
MNGIQYYRPARTYPEPLPTGEVKIVAPPPLQAPSKGGLIIALITAGLTIIAAYIMSTLYHNPIMAFAASIMAAISVITAIVQIVMQKNNRLSQQRSVKKKYIQYLDEQDDKLEKLVLSQKKYYDTLFPEPQQLLGFVQKRERIWERNRSDEDFLTVAMGRGPVPLSSKPKLEMDDNPFIEYDKNLIYRGKTLVSKYEVLEQGPIDLPLKQLGSLAVRGKRHMIQELTRAMLAQIAVFHAPEDVQMLVYFTKEVEPQWQWFKWLPHGRRPRSSKKLAGGIPLCYMAQNAMEFHQMFNEAVLPRILAVKKAREERKNQQQTPAALPHQLLILDGIDINTLISQSTELSELFSSATEAGITIISLVDGRYSIPQAFASRIQMGDAGEFTFEEMAFSGRRVEGKQAERLDLATSDEIARGLAPFVQSEKASQISLADTVKMTDLLQIRSAAHIDPATSWQAKPRERVLRAPIGLRVDGQPVIVDLKEAADGGMGVHGLVIGATGSGKSELLRSLVVGLAVDNDAEMLNFIFVDFKGGAAFADLSHLPHSAGMITNLEGDNSMIDRFYQSLMGEMDRRQRRLREAGNLDNVKQYQNKRATNPFLEPLPYLVVVIDEFGELLAAQPEFTDLFVKIGRIGRSIGIHLLFATQRLEEGRLKGLETHLRYRICLRTFSEAESKAVIGTPDAFYLPSYPGVGYFKVDTHIYDLFKTASVSGPYTPISDRPELAVQIGEFNTSGRVVDFQLPGLDEVAATKQVTKRGDDRTEMEVIIQGLVDHAKHLQQEVHQVWVEPLNRNLTLDGVFKPQEFLERLFNTGNYPYFNGQEWPTRPVRTLLKVPVGVLDLPLQQRQEPLILDFLGNEGHLAIVGAPQSGKSTLLRTIITSFLATHKPSDAQFYAIDLGGGLLRPLEAAPHVGTVYGKSDKDKFPIMIRQIHTLIDEREQFFRQHGIDTMQTFRERRAAGEYQDQPGDVFLVIDDLAQLQSEFFELVDNEVTELVTTGLNYGIHVIVTANRWADLRMKIRDNITGRLELRLNEPNDSEVNRAAQKVMPRDIAGRGVVREGFYFQVAQPLLDVTGIDPSESLPKALDAFVQATREAWTGAKVQPVRILPLQLRTTDLEPQRLLGAGVPLGIEESRLDVVSFDPMGNEPHFMLYGDGESGKTTFLRQFMRGMMAHYSPEQVQFIVIDFRRMLYEFVNDAQTKPYVKHYAWSGQMLNDPVYALRGELDPRIQQAASSPDPKAGWTGPHYFLILDDYDMVSAAMGNPITGLADYLLQARDIGFHTVLARRVGGSSRSFDQFPQRLKEMSAPGIILAGDPNEGMILGNQRAALLPPGRGYLVRRNQKVRQVQLFMEEE